MLRSVEKTLSRGFALFGIALAVPALLSLASSFSLVSLSGFSLTLVDIYEGLLSPIFLLIASPFRLLAEYLGFEIPAWVTDLQALSITGGGIFFRAANAAHERTDDPLSLDIREYMEDYGIERQTNLLYLKTMMLSLTGFGLLVVAASLLMMPVTALHFIASRLRRTGFDFGNIAFQGGIQMAVALISCIASVFADFVVALAA